MAANHRYLYTPEKLRDRLEQFASSYGGRAWDENELVDLEATKQAQRIIFNPYAVRKSAKELEYLSSDDFDEESYEALNEAYVKKQFTSITFEAENNNVDCDPDYPKNTKILTHYTLSLCVRLPIDRIVEIPEAHQHEIKQNLNRDTLTEEDLITDRLYQAQTISYMYSPYTNSINLRQEVTVVDDDDVEIAGGAMFDSRDLDRPVGNVRPHGSKLPEELATLFEPEESLAKSVDDLTVPDTAEQIFINEAFEETVDTKFDQPRLGAEPQHQYIKQMFRLIAALEDNDQWSKIID